MADLMIWIFMWVNDFLIPPFFFIHQSLVSLTNISRYSSVLTGFSVCSTSDLSNGCRPLESVRLKVPVVFSPDHSVSL